MITIITSTINMEFVNELTDFLLKNGEHVNVIHRGRLPGLKLLDRIRTRYSAICNSDLVILLQGMGHNPPGSYETREAYEKIFAEMVGVPVMTVNMLVNYGEEIDYAYRISNRVQFWRKGGITDEEITHFKVFRDNLIFEQ